MNLKSIPRSVSKQMLPGLKVSDLVQLRTADFSQDKKDGSTKYLPAMTVGRVKRIYDMGRLKPHLKHHRFLVYVRIPGHPETNFWSEELTKVAVR
jgi:hypothetical protein